MFNSPFTQAGIAKTATKGLLKNKLTFNGIVTNLEKTVSTINQVVPLYNQVKPLISNSKTIINAFKSTRTKSNKTQKNNINKKDFDPNIINVEVKTPTPPIKDQNHNEYSNIFTNINTPTKPFFI